MSKKYTTMIIVLVSVIAVIGIAVGVSFAVWVSIGEGAKPQDTSKVEVLNTSSKYLVFEVGKGEKYFYASYFVQDIEGQDVGSFMLNQEFQTKYQDENTVDTSTFDNGTNKPTFARVIGFVDYYNNKGENKGYALGEVEDIIIPNTIKIKINDVEIADIPVTEINMQSPEEFSALRGIKSVVVPENVTNIKGVSFTGCVNLVRVTYEGNTTVTVEDRCFIGCGTNRNNLLKPVPEPPPQA